MIEYIAFFNNQTQEYVTTGLWYVASPRTVRCMSIGVTQICVCVETRRDAAGAEASYQFGLTRANYKLFMSQTVEYAGEVRNFFGTCLVSTLLAVVLTNCVV